jgi:hypothetical protein
MQFYLKPRGIKSQWRAKKTIVDKLLLLLIPIKNPHQIGRDF